MTVPVEYAQSHLHELLDAAEGGSQVEITRPNGVVVKLVSEPTAEPKPDRSSLFGIAKGKIWYADDWDSPEVNEEIARSFNESELFPPES